MKKMYLGNPMAKGLPCEITDPPPEHLFLTERSNGEVYLHFKTMDPHRGFIVNVSSLGSDDLPGARKFVKTWIREFREGLYHSPTT